MEKVKVIGGGLAGCEAAWHLAQSGIKVDLLEMRPQKSTPAHDTDKLAELVCSNSLRSKELTNAAGLLKEEMRILDSIVMRVADRTQIPAGAAMAVDREMFSSEITSIIKDHPNINLYTKEVTEMPDTPAVLASGPLTSEKLSLAIANFLGNDHLYFYDSAAPIVTAESIDWNKAFWASRYDKGDADYVNLPLSQEEYYNFYNELIRAERYKPRDFEKPVFFEGCMPLEVMADRGYKTLLFGPLKPVGIIDSRTGKQPFAVIQLRKENVKGSLLNIVGFQTSLKWGEQKRVFSLIPGLEKAEFVRYGFIHRNTFINSPVFLEPSLQFKGKKNLFFAGQITGVEGYIESAASGIVAGINLARAMKGEKSLVFPKDTVIGALCHYITTSNSNSFQPMKANFGILPPLEKTIKPKKDRNKFLSQRSIESLMDFYSL